ncbi:hypothetical protein HPB48_012264 [Haemaphysalis longicornis]|uniref:CUB domain-containing protein n=1 Tax=Haemaphysalis longicornis TaxID=44386 RepID=A0A9J6GVE9_HAELO|nr:hypothetical protein HPB48_012264 [Haemaphysalis longicornis]
MYARSRAEPLYRLCNQSLTLAPTGPNSAAYVVADPPRSFLPDECSFSVRANSSDGVVVSVQRLKLRTSTAVESICLDYLQASHPLCGSRAGSYELSVPMDVKLYTNPTQSYEPGQLVSFVITGYNKTTQDDCKGGSFTCANARCIWEGFSCDKVDNCGDGSDERFFVYSMCS